MVGDAAVKMAAAAARWCGFCDVGRRPPIANIECDSKLGVLRVAFNASGAPGGSCRCAMGSAHLVGWRITAAALTAVFVETHSTTKPLRVLEQRLVSWQDATSLTTKFFALVMAFLIKYRNVPRRDA